MKRPINENGRTATEFANALGEQKAFKDYLQAPLVSPLFGFTAAAMLFLLLKFTVRNAELYTAPKGNQALDRARYGSAQRSRMHPTFNAHMRYPAEGEERRA